MAKKFLAALNADGRSSTRAPFVMPSPDGASCFVSLKTGKEYATAYVVYTGVELTSNDVASKASHLGSQETLLCLAESLLQELTRFKIGNVVEVVRNSGQTVELGLIAARPKQ